MSDDAVRLEAEALDRAIDGFLGYEEAAPDEELSGLVRHLAVLHEAPLPPELREDVAARIALAPAGVGVAIGQRAPRWPVRVMAAVLGVLFLVQGGPAVFASEQLADFLGLAHEPHVYTEAGIMALAVGAALILASARPKWIDSAVVVGVPIALALGIFGVYEIGHAPNPAAELLHVAQALAAVALGAGWWSSRRKA